MPTAIEATYRAVTPLFCAGADSARPELRLPSFKGALRFWWRALAWPRCGGDLKAIQRREDRLFGSADGGQSRVLMRFAPTEATPAIYKKDDILTVVADNHETVGAGARYLGYGVMEAFDSWKRGTKAAQLTRGCLRAPFDFTVQLRCRGLSEADIALLREALIALGTLSGMGAKSRKGYGSLALRSLLVNGEQCWSAPESADDLKAAIGQLRCNRETDDLPKYTAFSSGARHVLLSGEDAKPLQLLDRVGRELVRYRSWGRDRKILGQIDSEKNFRLDHDLMKKSPHERNRHPERIAFGLPHNYGKGAVAQVGPHHDWQWKLDRRASPLFIHIHECGGAPVAVLSFLPALFLPQGTAVSVGGKKVLLAQPKELYRPIHDFLDRLLDESRCKERFDEAIEVRP